ncbi:MAG TPA: hypothetical protein VJB34_00570, partial [Bdellovibrionota bacterium]|nr:hypothetical protein [Bdellovibrionota bacterium]
GLTSLDQFVGETHLDSNNSSPTQQSGHDTPPSNFNGATGANFDTPLYRKKIHSMALLVTNGKYEEALSLIARELKKESLNKFTSQNEPGYDEHFYYTMFLLDFVKNIHEQHGVSDNILIVDTLIELLKHDHIAIRMISGQLLAQIQDAVDPVIVRQVDQFFESVLNSPDAEDSWFVRPILMYEFINLHVLGTEPHQSAESFQEALLWLQYELSFAKGRIWYPAPHEIDRDKYAELTHGLFALLKQLLTQGTVRSYANGLLTEDSYKHMITGLTMFSVSQLSTYNFEMTEEERITHQLVLEITQPILILMGSIIEILKQRSELITKINSALELNKKTEIEEVQEDLNKNFDLGEIETPAEAEREAAKYVRDILEHPQFMERWKAIQDAVLVTRGHTRLTLIDLLIKKSRDKRCSSRGWAVLALRYLRDQFTGPQNSRTFVQIQQALEDFGE